MKPRCSWCELPIDQAFPRRCYKCKKLLCTPYLRNCAWDHWKSEHDPGLGLNPDERELYRSGEWVG